MHKDEKLSFKIPTEQQKLTLLQEALSEVMQRTYRSEKRFFEALSVSLKKKATTWALKHQMRADKREIKHG
ncbi:hypothetical protein PT277_01670 [Acetobacteraceae bacterium ESL0709]|nr:hypothetical protein [Acetobacteraceae bacterium ESL0697]MDF7677410.1 hypothetical protein [Acetobacteraceae bacterium ESL0709]